MTGSDSELAFILLVLIIGVPYGLWVVYKAIAPYLQRRKDDSPRRY